MHNLWMQRADCTDAGSVEEEQVSKLLVHPRTVCYLICRPLNLCINSLVDVLCHCMWRGRGAQRPSF